MRMFNDTGIECMIRSGTPGTKISFKRVDKVSSDILNKFAQDSCTTVLDRHETVEKDKLNNAISFGNCSLVNDETFQLLMQVALCSLSHTVMTYPGGTLADLISEMNHLLANAAAVNAPTVPADAAVNPSSSPGKAEARVAPLAPEASKLAAAAQQQSDIGRIRPCSLTLVHSPLALTNSASSLNDSASVGRAVTITVNAVITNRTLIPFCFGTSLKSIGQCCLASEQTMQAMNNTGNSIRAAFICDKNNINNDVNNGIDEKLCSPQTALLVVRDGVLLDKRGVVDCFGSTRCRYQNSLRCQWRMSHWPIRPMEGRRTVEAATPSSPRIQICWQSRWTPTSSLCSTFT